MMDACGCGACHSDARRKKLLSFSQVYPWNRTGFFQIGSAQHRGYKLEPAMFLSERKWLRSLMNV
jgi:hypothetical protein